MAESDVDEDDSDTALAAAVGRGQFEVVRRIKIEPAQDDVTALANAYRVWPNPKLIEMLIKLGADVRNQTGAINSAFSGFEWSFPALSRVSYRR